MAIGSVIDIARLDEGYILAPERYDPRRSRLDGNGPRLSDFVNVLREQVTASKCRSAERFLIFDTGDAHNGIIKPTKTPSDGSSIRSAKKRIRPHQVLISRLRPYLRQVAWVDVGLGAANAQNTELLCSTEFFVLDSADGTSIAFLVPFLLSPQIQSILAASQEGGHHPRFSERTLKSLPVPKHLIERRAVISAQMEQAVNQARKAYRMIQESMEAVDKPSCEDTESSWSP